MYVELIVKLPLYTPDLWPRFNTGMKIGAALYANQRGKDSHLPITFTSKIDRKHMSLLKTYHQYANHGTSESPRILLRQPTTADLTIEFIVKRKT